MNSTDKDFTNLALEVIIVFDFVGLYVENVPIVCNFDINGSCSHKGLKCDYIIRYACFICFKQCVCCRYSSVFSFQSAPLECVLFVTITTAFNI